MPLWKVKYDPSQRAFRHRLAKGFGNAMLASTQAYAFEAIRLCAAIHLAGEDWLPLHTEPTVMAFEHGQEGDRRGPYNERCFAEVERKRAPHLGSYGGFCDLFVPCIKNGEIVGVVVVGPFATAHRAAVDILECWRRLTHRQGHPEDPQFAGYLAATLATPVLSRGQVAALRRLLVAWTHLAMEDGNPETLANAIERDRVILDAARHVDRMWETVRTMVDDRFQLAWLTRSQSPEFVYWGLPRAPDRVLVGLSALRSGAHDPVEAIVRRNALQRGVVALVRPSGVLSGRVGDHGVVLLAVTEGSEKRRVAQLTGLAQRVAAWARRQFGVSLHFGATDDPSPRSLSRRYQGALAAARSALFEAKDIVVVRSSDQAGARSLFSARRALERLLEESPDRIEAHFDQYLEVVLAECGYRLEAARAHLEVGLERLIEALARRGVLDEQSSIAIREDLERAVMSASDVNGVFDDYRRAVADLAKASRTPSTARRERSLERALDYIAQHYMDPLRLELVARVAGFAPGYFSRRFIASEGVPFRGYVTALRINRVKHLLATTDLNLSRVARLCGFPTAGYLCTAFRRSLGATPGDYRAKNLRRRPVVVKTERESARKRMTRARR